MTKPGAKYKIGASPRKLALIGVLGVVQMIVIVRQLPAPQSSIVNPPPNTNVAGPGGPATGATESATTDTTDDTPRPWPEFTLEKVIANNPFAEPHWARRNSLTLEAAQQPINPEALTQLQQQGASIVVIAGTEKAATIGAQRVRIGDIIDGYRITDITTRGVVLREHVPQ